MNKNFRIREEAGMSSAPTHGNESNDFVLPPQQLQMQMQMQMQMQVSSYQGSMPSAEWTDEKHSMYIKSIEASFVDQLYDLKETFGNCVSQVQTSPDSATVSSQFKVFQGGIWQENSFVRENPQRSRLHECHDLKSRPWIQHYGSSCKQGIISSEVAIVDTEMSDQNFADEEEEGEKENNNTRDVKRFKSF